MLSDSKISDILWDRIEPLIYISKEAFVAYLKEWEMHLWPNSEDPEFVAFVKGPEFHYASLKPKASLSRKAIVEFLNKIIAREGHAITRTPLEDERQQRFNELIGFQKIGEDEYDIIFKIEKVK